MPALRLRMATLFGAVLFATAATLRWASADDPPVSLEKRIAEIAAKPGLFQQMCSMTPSDPAPMIPFFGFTRDEMKISPDQFSELREQRDAAVAILRRDIADAAQQMQAEEAARPAPEPIAPDARGWAIYSPRGSFDYESRLLLLLDLNGSEALEDLIAAAERIALPKAGDKRAGSVAMGNSPSIATYSAILGLLRQENDPAVLKSEYMDAWRKRLSGQGSLSAEEYEKLPAANRAYYVFDPQENRAVSSHQYEKLELTPKRAKQILDWAKDFVKRVPVEKRAGAKNMSQAPVAR